MSNGHGKRSYVQNIAKITKLEELRSQHRVLRSTDSDSESLSCRPRVGDEESALITIHIGNADRQ